MSMNDSVTFHEALGAPKGHHHHPHHARPFIVNRYYDSGYPYYYGTEYDATRSIEDEVAFHEARHDCVVLRRTTGGANQLRQAVVDRLKSRGWEERQEAGGAWILCPPGLVHNLKGLGLIRGLGVITGPVVQPVEILGLGVGGAMILGGVVVEGPIGTVLMILGGGVGLVAGGSVVLRLLSGMVQQSQAATMPPPMPPPPPPPPPPKPTAQQRLTSAVQAYGPVAQQLITGLIKLI